MKTTILLLLFLSSLKGYTQTGNLTLPPWYKIDSNGMLVYVPDTTKVTIGSTPSSDISPVNVSRIRGLVPAHDSEEYFIVAFLKYYDQYKVECYNDSTARYYYTICDWDCWEVPCEKGKEDPIRGVCPANWEHRFTTLEGFVEFLRKKK